MRFDVLTAFPEVVEVPLSTSVLGIARNKNIFTLHVHDLRDWTTDKHRSIDDYPYGGGPGMVLRPEPIFSAIRSISSGLEAPPHIVFMSPRGARFTQSDAERFSLMEHILLVCGRYEGFDERVYALADECISVGDYILTGGEIPAITVIDATVRLLPYALGDDASIAHESFTIGLLEHPHYTRPSCYEGREVPEVLRSGDHSRIARWRREQSVKLTARLRPDLLQSAQLSDAEREHIDDLAERNDCE